MTCLRNIRGMHTNEIGIVSKPCNTISSNKFQIEKNRAFDKNIEKLVNDRQQMFSEELKINFFTDADSKARMNRLKRNVNEIMNQRNFLISDRRAKLKALLSAEQTNYERELLSSAITPLERAAQLREKAKQIRNNKENEMALFVKEKMDEKWKSECDELRTFQSKQLQSGMRTEHLRQIEEKICRERHRLEEEAVFADLWQKDYEAKKFKEEEKARISAEKNRETSAILKEQMQVLEDQKQEEKRLRNENMRLIEEKMNIEELEKKIQFQKKREAQAERRHELDICVKARLINEAKRAREEMSFDIKALEESMISFQNEDEEKAKRKIELLEEQQRYREYLRAQHEEEKRREKELDQIIEEDVERQFQKRLNEWKLQRQARKALFEKVLRERRLQIEEKVQRNKEKELYLQKEKEEQQKLVEHCKRQEEMEKHQRHQKIRNYNQDLQGQMQYNHLQKAMLNEGKADEFRNYMVAEDDYQRRLNDKMNDIQIATLKRRPDINNGFCYQCKDDLKL